MAVTRVSNVIRATANSDSIEGPVRASGIVVKGGASGGTVVLSVNSKVIFDSSAVAATTSVDFDAVNLNVQQGKSISVAITGTAEIWLYLK